MDRLARRARVLFDHGASMAVADELLAYSAAPDGCYPPAPVQIPLASEPFVAVWREYAADAASIGVLPSLRKGLIQLRFPVRAGISQSHVYRDAMRRGEDRAGDADGELALEHPDALQLLLHQTPAGTIPVVVARGRHDFESLVQALAHKNEPQSIPGAMGACIISGYRNWDRINRLRQAWETTTDYPPVLADVFWRQELRDRILPAQPLYQDSFILLSDGDYSGIAASAIGCSAEVWRRDSLLIRLEHECMHYVMRRLCSSRPSPIVEDLIADLRGMVAAWGVYAADHALRFLGLEAFPHYRDGGRLELYLSTPLTEAAFSVLTSLVQGAVINLERIYNRQADRWATDTAQVQLALALACLTLEELADPRCHKYVESILGLMRAEVPGVSADTRPAGPGRWR